MFLATLTNWSIALLVIGFVALIGICLCIRIQADPYSYMKED